MYGSQGRTHRQDVFRKEDSPQDASCSPSISEIPSSRCAVCRDYITFRPSPFQLSGRAMWRVCQTQLPNLTTHAGERVSFAFCYLRRLISHCNTGPCNASSVSRTRIQCTPQEWKTTLQFQAIHPSQPYPGWINESNITCRLATMNLEATHEANHLLIELRH